ncbi:uncharacterized protein [Erythrolamprus reginae]|uniref:uncharacterized protein isoform X2 n=1 Tax=Erythrolamprus reginae TaxID=121349 RepID=UPI00396C83C8
MGSRKGGALPSPALREEGPAKNPGAPAYCSPRASGGSKTPSEGSTMAPQGFSPEQLARWLAEAEALLAAHVSEPIRASWCWAWKLGGPPDAERLGAELRQIRRGREALLAGDAALSAAQQERLQALLGLEVVLLRRIQAQGLPGAAPALRRALLDLAAALEGPGSLARDPAVVLQLALEALLERRPREALWALEWMMREEGRARPWRRPWRALIRALQAQREDELPLDELRPQLERALRLVRRERRWPAADRKETPERTLAKISPEEAELHGEPPESGKAAQFQGLNLNSENPEERRDCPDYSGEPFFNGISHVDPSQPTSSGNGKSVFVGSSVSSEVEEPAEARTQVLVSLEEVVVSFSKDEWSLLDATQKALYRDVMLENSRNVALVDSKSWTPRKECSQKGQDFCFWKWKTLPRGLDRVVWND